MTDDDLYWLVSVAGLLLVTAVGCLFTGCDAGAVKATREMRLEAVKHGAAEWEVHDDGSTSFKWKNNQ